MKKILFYSVALSSITLLTACDAEEKNTSMVVTKDDQIKAAYIIDNNCDSRQLEKDEHEHFVKLVDDTRKQCQIEVHDLPSGGSKITEMYVKFANVFKNAIGEKSCEKYILEVETICPGKIKD